MILFPSVALLTLCAFTWFAADDARATGAALSANWPNDGNATFALTP